jgi:hypothetical protein
VPSDPRIESWSRHGCRNERLLALIALFEQQEFLGPDRTHVRGLVDGIQHAHRLIAGPNAFAE